MGPAERLRDAEALDWVRRLQDPGFVDWDAHVSWLEADPANPAAFDRMALVMEGACEGLGSPTSRPAREPPANDNRVEAEAPTPRRHHWLWGGGALAAGIAVLFAAAPTTRSTDGSIIETAAGAKRTVSLPDGTRIALNGGSRIRLDGAAPRTVQMLSGEAFFDVAHDSAHPFRVRAGDAVLQDVGTSFDVVRSQAATEVAVRDGAVSFDPDGAAVMLRPGQALRVAGGTATLRRVEAGDVGGWREGRLAFRDAPLADVAAAIARSIGQPVTLDAQLLDRRFSGVVRIEADRAATVRRFAAVADLSLRRDGRGWLVAPAAR